MAYSISREGDAWVTQYRERPAPGEDEPRAGATVDHEAGALYRAAQALATQPLQASPVSAVVVVVLVVKTFFSFCEKVSS